MEAVLPVGRICYDARLFNPSDAASGPLFPSVINVANRELIVCRAEISELRHHHPFSYPIYPFHLPRPIHLKERMSDTQAELEKSVEEVVRKYMADRGMSEGVQASSTRGLQASPSTARCSSHANPATEKRSKHRDDLANAKQIPSILPDYIPPLAGAVNHDSIPWDFEYTLITVHPEGDTHSWKPVGPDPILKEQ
jgi:hypothetical protein